MKKKVVLVSIFLSSIIALLQSCSKDDTTSPVVTLNGDLIITIGKGDAFVDPSATASDNEDGVINVTSDAASVVNVNEPDVYTVTYTATDKAGNYSTETRTVIVNWKNTQLSAFGYNNTESDSDYATDSVIVDTYIATVENSSLSNYHFTFQPVFLGLIINPIKTEVYNGKHFAIASQKPNGTGSKVTVEGIGEGTISHTGSQIKLDFQVLVTDSGSNPPGRAKCTIHAISN